LMFIPMDQLHHVLLKRVGWCFHLYCLWILSGRPNRQALGVSLTSWCICGNKPKAHGLKTACSWHSSFIYTMNLLRR
jgi:hypothetical protein